MPPSCESEGLSRHFGNGRQVAAYAGLAPRPWQSGSVDHDQGVAEAGNPRLGNDADPDGLAVAAPSTAIGAHLVVPGPVKHNGGRLKKSTIVTLARKLLVALWKYVSAGVIMEGAIMKTA